MNNGGLSTEFDILDLENGGSGLSPSQKLDMGGNGMWLVLFGEAGAEMRGDDL